MTARGMKACLRMPAIVSIAALGGFLVGCGPSGNDVAEVGRPVEIALVEASILTNVARMTGDVQAQKDVGLAFRVGGKVIERHVNIGDTVKAGQILARLDTQTAQNALVAATAARMAALGEAETTRTTHSRQQHLMRQGFTTRPRYEQALTAKEVAQSRLEEAEAQVALAQDRISFATLVADTAGVVTVRSLEPGEVVQPGQVVLRVARDDGRDAVFDVAARLLDQQPAGGKFHIALASNPEVVALGKVREIAEKADPVTGTFRVRIGLENPPAAMELGSTIFGSLEKSSSTVVSIPSSALTTKDGDAAVWNVDPISSRVTLKKIEILRFEPTRVIISQGIYPGEIIVAAGIQALHHGQLVKSMKPAAAGSAAGQASMIAPDNERLVVALTRPETSSTTALIQSGMPAQEINR